MMYILTEDEFKKLVPVSRLNEVYAVLKDKITFIDLLNATLESLNPKEKATFMKIYNIKVEQSNNTGTRIA
jgi:hypothetical protein